METTVIALALQDRLSQFASEMRRMENRISKLEAEIIELKRNAKPKIETTTDNLIRRGASYE